MSMKRASLLIGFLLVAFVPASAQVGDIYASVTQPLVDKVLSDVQYPFTVINMWDTFHPPTTVTFAGRVSEDDLTALYKWAETNKKKNLLAHEIVVHKASFLADIDRLEACRKLADENHIPFDGPTKAEVDKIRDLSDWDSVFFLAHFRSDIMKKPNLLLNGKTTQVRGLLINSEAIGEWWVKRPKLECTGNCQIGPVIFCCHWDWIYVWEKWGTASVNDFPLAVDATLTADVDAKNILFLSGQFDSLRIPIPPILDKIPIEKIVNPIIADKHFDVEDLNALVATVPYVDLHYGIKALRLSGTKELRVDIDVVKKP
jgi:hypothetical protein